MLHLFMVKYSVKRAIWRSRIRWHCRDPSKIYNSGCQDLKLRMALNPAQSLSSSALTATFHLDPQRFMVEAIESAKLLPTWFTSPCCVLAVKGNELVRKCSKVAGDATHQVSNTKPEYVAVLRIPVLWHAYKLYADDACVGWKETQQQTAQNWPHMPFLFFLHPFCHLRWLHPITSKKFLAVAWSLHTLTTSQRTASLQSSILMPLLNHAYESINKPERTKTKIRRKKKKKKPSNQQSASDNQSWNRNILLQKLVPRFPRRALVQVMLLHSSVVCLDSSAVVNDGRESRLTSWESLPRTRDLTPLPPSLPQLTHSHTHIFNSGTNEWKCECSNILPSKWVSEWVSLSVSLSEWVSEWVRLSAPNMILAGRSGPSTWPNASIPRISLVNRPIRSTAPEASFPERVPLPPPLSSLLRFRLLCPLLFLFGFPVLLSVL